MAKKIVNVIYDLKYAPVTYDFTTYLAWCESVRQIYGADELLLTVKANDYRDKTQKDLGMDPDEKDWRVQTIILDACELLPSITTKTLLKSDMPIDPKNYHLPEGYGKFEEKNLGYPYSIKHLVEVYTKYKKCPKVLEAPKHAQKLVRQSAGEGFITLTLRHSQYWPKRNIDLDEWYKFHNYLIEKGHRVLVIPDFEDVFFKSIYKNYSWDVFLPASIDQRIRMALYGQALMNFMPSGGAGAMAIYSNRPYVVLDVAAPKVFGAEHVSNQIGIPIDSSPPWAGENQGMIWEESTFATLVSAYDQFVA